MKTGCETNILGNTGYCFRYARFFKNPRSKNVWRALV